MSSRCEIAVKYGLKYQICQLKHVHNVLTRRFHCVFTVSMTFSQHASSCCSVFTARTRRVTARTLRAHAAHTAFSRRAHSVLMAIIAFKIFYLYLAHLSTKCWGWAIVIGLCPSSVVRRASSVVRKLFYLNIFFSETAHWILTKLHRNDPWVVPYQSCSNGSDWLHK